MAISQKGFMLNLTPARSMPDCKRRRMGKEGERGGGGSSQSAMSPRGLRDTFRVACSLDGPPDGWMDPTYPISHLRTLSALTRILAL